jgi:two-component system, NarL family, response regulator DevR
VIRVAVLDDHPAVLVGLRRLLESGEDLSLVTAADNPERLFRALCTTRADVVILDYHLTDGDGLAVCRRLKDGVRRPGVVIYSAYAGPALAFASRIAGADAIVDKRADVSELLDAVRGVAGGASTLPEVPLEVHHALMARLEADELPVAAMLLAGTPDHGIADALGTDRRDIAQRARRILARIGPHAASPPSERPPPVGVAQA